MQNDNESRNSSKDTEMDDTPEKSSITKYLEKMYANSQEPHKLEALEKLIIWADESGISDFYFPRYTEQLAQCYSLKIHVKSKPIPREIIHLTKLEKLSITFDDSSLFPDSILELENLKSLSVAFCDAESLPFALTEVKCALDLHLTYKNKVNLPENLTDINQLNYLQITNDTKSTISYDFSTLSNLVTLTLDGESVIEMQNGSNYSQNFKHLELNCDNPMKIPESIGRINSLTKLSIINMHLKSLPSGIAKLTNLRKLIIACPNMIALPSSVTQLNKLEELTINFDNILTSFGRYSFASGQSAEFAKHDTTLPDTLVDLINLKKLYIHSNYLHQLPENIGHLKNLKKLVVYSHCLSQIPESIGQLESLQSIAISSSKPKIDTEEQSYYSRGHDKEIELECKNLESIPDSIGNLVQLESLTINSDKLTRLPDSIGNLTNLVSLDIPSYFTNQLSSALKNRYIAGKLSIREVPMVMLYKPKTDELNFANVGFVLFEDDWNEEELNTLKHQARLELLLALKTSSDKQHKIQKKFQDVDSIIECEVDQIERIMHLIQNMFYDPKTITTDFNDICSFFWQCSYIKYAESVLYSSGNVIEQHKLEEFINNLLLAGAGQLILNLNLIDYDYHKQGVEIEALLDQLDDSLDVYLTTMTCIEKLNFDYLNVIYSVEQQQDL